MEIINSEIEKYMEHLLNERDSIFKKLEEYAAKINFPIVEPLIGQLLQQYTKMINAKKIIELGSGFGYSALWFARGTEDDAKIICTDYSEDKARLAKKYFNEAGVENKIDFRIGDALKILSELDEEFDIIFNDVDKEEYPETFKLAINRLKIGGLLITDNSLWYGGVIKENPKSLATQGVKEYNRLAFSDPRVISTLLPIRDGICVSLKISL